MGRAEETLNEGRKANVGFALMTLQRRLASSPRAIHNSIIRRRDRLTARLNEARQSSRAGQRADELLLRDNNPPASLSAREWDDVYDEAPQDEREALETAVIDYATAAQTVAELEAEIAILCQLEIAAKRVVDSHLDSKWTQLATILNDPLMTDDAGNRRKLVLFTEFKDTLLYLAEKISTLLGKPEAVVQIHGAVKREDRNTIVTKFRHDKATLILVANDAAGEGVNLQSAHLMVNYDLPWNPNRLEQRFGRIHRIGQQEVCHLWNLIAKDTREGDVYARLLRKLENEREALGGDKVYDVLGLLFEAKPLRDMLFEAVCYGNDPAVKRRLHEAVDGALDKQALARVFETRALVSTDLDASKLQDMRIEMQRAEARRLQPHFIQAFFLDAFTQLGGKIEPREANLWEITHVNKNSVSVNGPASLPSCRQPKPVTAPKPWKNACAPANKCLHSNAILPGLRPPFAAVR